MIPQFLGHEDHPWLRTLLEEYERFADRPRKDMLRHLTGALLASGAGGRRRAALHVLGRLWGDRRGGSLPPPRARAALFLEAARSPGLRDDVLARAAAVLETTPDEIEAALFADLPGERLVTVPKEPLSPSELALRTNQAIIQSLLFRSTAVELRLAGGARAVIRHAKLRGLICTVSGRAGGSDEATIEISGPFSVFRRTMLYGRSLAELLPLLAWCARFKLRAACRIRDRELILSLRTGDPVFPSTEPRRYDSRLEERFARDFRRAAPDWDIVREPEPIAVAGKLAFPDFVLTNRLDGRRWLVEIVGFWTADYLARKLSTYSIARLENLILCVDEERRCALESAAFGGRVIFYRRRIDPQVVLDAIGRG